MPAPVPSPSEQIIIDAFGIDHPPMTTAERLDQMDRELDRNPWTNE